MLERKKDEVGEMRKVLVNCVDTTATATATAEDEEEKKMMMMMEKRERERKRKQEGMFSTASSCSSFSLLVCWEERKRKK